ncbi:MAG TPA: hypothetical protein VIY86_01485, partial [Pirellulaceae bacterium]
MSNPFPRRRGKITRGLQLLRLENLEDRRLLAAISWNTDSNGFWDVATNWSPQQVPGSGDQVTIDRGAANPAITVRDFRFVGSFTSRESLVVDPLGTLRIEAASQIEASTLVVQGTLQPLAQVTVMATGQIDWQSGNIFGNGTKIAAGGTLGLSGSADKRLAGLITNHGLIVHAGDGDLLLDGSSIVANNPGAVYDFAGDGDIGPSGGGAGFASYFQNDGTMRKSAGTGATSEVSL